MDRALTVREVERVDVPSAAASLAKAFYDDPVCKYAWPEDAKRPGRSQRFFATSINTLWRRREVHSDEEFSSVAVWAPPDQWQIPARSLPSVVATSIRTRLRVKALAAYLRTDALHPEEPHWYLEFLGTVPAKQGTGAGSRVLTAGLERADEEGRPVWAWSSNPRNLAFYHRHGFEVLDELPFAADGPPIFPIRREPR